MSMTGTKRGAGSVDGGRLVVIFLDVGDIALRMLSIEPNELSSAFPLRRSACELELELDHVCTAGGDWVVLSPAGTSTIIGQVTSRLTSGVVEGEGE